MILHDHQHKTYLKHNLFKANFRSILILFSNLEKLLFIDLPSKKAEKNVEKKEMKYIR